MPVLDVSPYRPPALLRGPHLETVLPNLTRRRFRVSYVRQRLELSDGDFVDLDTAAARPGSVARTCVLILHGLEGSAEAPYVKSFALAAGKFGYDAVAMNLRGCSGEPNRLPRFYHSGETGDLKEAIALLSQRYERICLLGFSLGGNVVMKYLGEAPAGVSPKVACGVAVSAPVDLAGSAKRLGAAGNRFYMRRFILLLARKLEEKAQLYPEVIDTAGCREMQSFEEFDGEYTAPLNGFASAEDYWARCSAANWLSELRIPALLLNARNDPFLSEECFPEKLAGRSAFLYSCFPDAGGHLGFPGRRNGGLAWHERVALEFMRRFSG